MMFLHLLANRDVIEAAGLTVVADTNSQDGQPVDESLPPLQIEVKGTRAERKGAVKFTSKQKSGKLIFVYTANYICKVCMILIC